MILPNQLALTVLFHALTMLIIAFIYIGIGVIWEFVNNYRNAKNSRALAQRHQDRMNKLRKVALSLNGYKSTCGKYPKEITQLVSDYIQVEKLFLDSSDFSRRPPKPLGSSEDRPFLKSLPHFETEFLEEVCH